MKRTRALLAAALPLTLLTATLAGCSFGGSGVTGSGAVDSAITADASGAACLTGGDVSKAVKVDGEFGDLLTLSAKTPLPKLKSTQRSVLIEGETTPFAEGETANVSVTIFNGKDGETLNHFPSGPMPNDAAQLEGVDWAYDAVRCGAPGQRVAIAMTANDATGGDVAGAGFTDLADDDPIVFVLDFSTPYDELADCKTVTPRDEKYPEVELFDATTSPKITIPECMQPPTELELKVLEEGDGPVVQDGDVVMTSYVGVTWNGAEVFNDNWDETGIRFDTNGVIPGFKQALVGQKIGSTVLVTVPPALGYGVEDPANSSNGLSGQTLTFVLRLISLTE